MADQYVGNLKKMESKAGNTYFKGMLGKVPIVGFWGKKDPNTINLKLDVGLIKWIDEQDEQERPQRSYSQEESAGPADEGDLPF